MLFVCLFCQTNRKVGKIFAGFRKRMYLYRDFQKTDVYAGFCPFTRSYPILHSGRTGFYSTVGGQGHCRRDEGDCRDRSW